MTTAHPLPQPAWRAAVLDIARQLLREVHPRLRVEPGVDSLLDRDLGFDSLTVVELRDRLEDALGVRLPDEVLAAAETLGDLLAGLEPAPAITGRPVAPIPVPRPVAPPALEEAPGGVGTLPEVVAWHVERHPDRVHARVLREDGGIDQVTYGALWASAEAVASGLQRRGIQRGDSVALMLPTGRAHLVGFLGVLLAGGVPVPIYPPFRPQRLEEHLRRQERILDNAGAVLLLTGPEVRRVGRLLRPGVPSLRDVVSVEELPDDEPPHPVHLQPTDTALLQYTSGSTGSPKGVVLDHAALLANVRAMGRVAEISSRDVFVSWLPLYHDMGLIGAWMTSLHFGMTLVLMSPLAFLSRPVRWLRAIHDHGGTVTASPNFGFELCLRLGDDDLSGLDLSSLRLAFNGAEPVGPDTIDRFQQRFAPYGLGPGVVAPVYGLAEAAVGLTFPPPGREPIIDEIDRHAFARHGKAVPGHPGPVLRFVACGRPLPGYEVRVVDAGGRELPERREGDIEFRGPSATSGYFHNPEATRRLHHEGWTRTGDLGYLADGDLYVTGRTKDLIVRAGHNIHPDVVEAAVGGVGGIRKGCVAVFGSTDPVAGTERLTVVAETRETGEEARGRLHEEVMRRVTDAIGAPPNEVVLVPPGTVLKTPSGKIRRSATREAYESGKLLRPPPGARRQVIRLMVRAALGRVRSTRRRIVALLFSTYAWLVAASIGVPAALALAALPRLRWRRGLARRAVRLAFGLAGVHVERAGLEGIPDEEPVVLVANHASLVDGIVLTAVLPPTVTFVAATEWLERPLIGRLLRRLGCESVTRHQRGRAEEDVERLVRRVRTGTSLLFFPEGALAPVAGLRPFHLGAFAVAARASVPLIPIGLRGTRAALRPGHRLVQRSRVAAEAGPPMRARDEGWYEVVRLRDESAAFILGRCGEPDLR